MVPDNGKKYDFFLFSDEPLTLPMHVYFCFEQANLVILALALLEGAREHRMPLTVFLWIQIVDMGLYMLYYDDPFVGVIPWNSIKLGLFVFAIGLEKWKHSTKGLTS